MRVVAEAFVYSAGFAGVCALIAAAAALAGVTATVVQRRRADERDEWGRRFLAALTLMAEDDARRRILGRALVDQLLKSPLASEDDRLTAERVIEAYAVEGGSAATATQLQQLMAAAGHPGALADVEFVQDDSHPPDVDS